MRHGSGVPPFDRIPPWLGPRLSSLCTTFPIDSALPDLPARVRPLFGAAESLRPYAIAPSANFPSLGTVARSDARLALAIELPCGTHPSPHQVGLPIPGSIPNCFPLWRHADPAAAPLRMLCVLRGCWISCNRRAPENTRLPYSSVLPPRLSPAI